MRYLTISEYGQFVGITGERLVVKEDSKVILEAPLSRIRSVIIAKKGVSFSSDLILSCSARGIRLFFTDWRGLATAAITGCHQHGLADLRRSQFSYQESTDSRSTAAGMIFGKIRNQRAVLLYFAKYHKQNADLVKSTAKKMSQYASRLKETDWSKRDFWRSEIMGIEGAAAAIYWEYIKVSRWMGNEFQNREGRGATTLGNQMLNYGYSILMSHIWSALDNAGFELYSGFLHKERSGRPSLVLDMMEEYRAWVVDRQIISMKSIINSEKYFNDKLKKKISEAINKCISTSYLYHGKRLRLDTIIQRQAYRLAGSVVGKKRYQPYRFKW